MSTQLFRHVILPVFEGGLKRRKTFRYLAELERTQWLPRERLAELQLEALRRLVAHAYEHSPYYRDLWNEHGLSPSRLTSLDELRHWPLTERQAIRENRSRMRAAVPGMQLIAKATGGSSGVPLQFDLNTDSHDRRVAASYRGYDWAGAGPGTKQLHLWGITLGDLPRWRQYKERLYHSGQRRRMLNSFQLSERTIPLFLDELNRYRPEVVVAYTSPLYTFARALKEQGLRPYSPRTIVVGSEKLYDFQREVIEEVFQAPVFETYGSREFMLMGAECDRHEGLHLTSEYQVMEVVDDQGRPVADGEEGHIAITDLYNYGMPFIRYVTGDRGIAGWKSCSCGRSLPLLRKVVGRHIDIVFTRDGRRIPGIFFPHLMKEYAVVERFQVVQERLDRIEIRVVLKRPWTPAEQEGLTAEIRKVVGRETAFELIPVDEIPLTAAGKLRVVVNHLITHPGSAPTPEFATAGASGSAQHLP